MLRRDLDLMSLCTVLKTWLSESVDCNHIGLEERRHPLNQGRDDMAKTKGEARTNNKEKTPAKAEGDSWVKVEEKAARAKAEEEARVRAEQAARAKAEQEARAKAEQEAQVKAEQEARVRAEQEAQVKAEQEARVKAEEEARVKAEQGQATKVDKGADRGVALSGGRGMRAAFKGTRQDKRQQEALGLKRREQGPGQGEASETLEPEGGEAQEVRAAGSAKARIRSHARESKTRLAARWRRPGEQEVGVARVQSRPARGLAPRPGRS